MRTKNHPKADSFVSDGFAVLRRFLNSSEIADMRIAVESLMALPPDAACSRPNNTLLPFRWNHPIVQIALASEHRVRVLTEALGASDLKWIQDTSASRKREARPCGGTKTGGAGIIL